MITSTAACCLSSGHFRCCRPLQWPQGQGPVLPALQHQLLPAPLATSALQALRPVQQPPAWFQPPSALPPPALLLRQVICLGEVFLCIWPLCNGYHMCVCWADCSAHCCFVRVGLPAQFSTYTPIWRAADQHVKQQWQAFRGTAAGLPCCSYLLLYRHAEHLLILPFSLCRPLPRPPHRQVSAMWRRCLHRQQQQPLLR